MSGWRLGVDIGGTFTDFVLADPASGRVVFHKTLTTPDEPARAVMLGIDDLLATAGVAPAEVEMLIHGTTLASNAVIERKGAQTGLLTTRGFRDVLEMGTEQRYDIHDLFLTFPEPIVARPHRLELDERTAADGEVLRRVDPAQVRQGAERLVRQGCRSLAVVLLHSYANPSNEELAAAAIGQLADAPTIALSHQVAPEVGEYDRASTTVVNAYIAPLIGDYLSDLQRRVQARGLRGSFYVMLSSGGMVSAATAAAFPVRILESGPAGGVMAAAHFGRAAALDSLLSFDMGGTTAKVCLIRHGEPARTARLEVARVERFKAGSGFPIRAPAIDLLEVGAGGGSIARIDAMGLLKVGPHSAGADPGPACYGRGGTQPTVTDAALVLGYLSPDAFLGGRLRLDVAAARRAIEAHAATPLGLSVEAAAWGVYALVSENMAAAVRIHCVERGVDPRRVVLMAFGGAGPVHAAHIARILLIPRVFSPPGAGVTSSNGFLVSPFAFDLSRSMPGLLRDLDWAALNAVLESLRLEGARLLADAGVSSERLGVTRLADMSLLGQSHQIPIRLPDGPLGPGEVPAIERSFHEEYARRYSHPAPDFPIQAVTWRVSVAEARAWTSAAPSAHSAHDAMPRERRPAYFQDTGWLSTDVYERATLPVGTAVLGPAIVEEPEATTVVPPGVELCLDENGNLQLSLPVAVPSTREAA